MNQTVKHLMAIGLLWGASTRPGDAAKKSHYCYPENDCDYDLFELEQDAYMTCYYEGEGTYRTVFLIDQCWFGDSNPDVQVQM
jgi:hypothetical protein